MFQFLLIVFLLIACGVLKAVHVVKDNQRLGIFRLGRFLGVSGPGVVLVVPLIDRAIRIKLDRHLPEWPHLSNAEIRTRIEKLVYGEPDLNKFTKD